MTTTLMQEQILNIAEKFLQTQGYNAFSYRDIANIVGIKTASIHYYYPAKADLVKAVVTRQLDIIQNAVENIFQNPNTGFKEKLIDVIDALLALAYSSDKKMCLGGMLASDIVTLPEEIQHEVKAFFYRLEKRLAKLLICGKGKGELTFKQDPYYEAKFFFALFEGSLLLARLYGDESRVALLKSELIKRLCE